VNERILVRAPTWLGDAVMATPALRALRAARPRAEIVVEGRAALADLLTPLPFVDAFLPDPGRGASALAKRVRALVRRRFDRALLLPDSVRAALGPFLARVPQRTGYARHPLRRALLSDVLEPPRANGRRLPLPTVERYLRITRRLDCPDRGRALELVVTDRARERVAERLRRVGVGCADALLLVAPGAAYGPSKCWPPGHFARACDGVARRRGLRPVVTVAPGEAPLARSLAAQAELPVTVLADPPLTLAELAALVERAALLLSNDTGPRHLAAALGTPVVVLMGPTDPRHSETGFTAERVLRHPTPCSPCQRRACPIDRRCLTRLAPERAVDAALQLLT
jgi:heptosyltransferase-2